MIVMKMQSSQHRDNMDCKALLLENKTLKDKVKRLQKRLDTAGKELTALYY